MGCASQQPPNPAHAKHDIRMHRTGRDDGRGGGRGGCPCMKTATGPRRACPGLASVAVFGTCWAVLCRKTERCTSWTGRAWPRAPPPHQGLMLAEEGYVSIHVLAVPSCIVIRADEKTSSSAMPRSKQAATSIRLTTRRCGQGSPDQPRHEQNWVPSRGTGRRSAVAREGRGRAAPPPASLLRDIGTRGHILGKGGKTRKARSVVRVGDPRGKACEQ